MKTMKLGEKEYTVIDNQEMRELQRRILNAKIVLEMMESQSDYLRNCIKNGEVICADELYTDFCTIFMEAGSAIKQLKLAESVL